MSKNKAQFSKLTHINMSRPHQNETENLDISVSEQNPHAVDSPFHTEKSSRVRPANIETPVEKKVSTSSHPSKYVNDNNLQERSSQSNSDFGFKKFVEKSETKPQPTSRLSLPKFLAKLSPSNSNTETNNRALTLVGDSGKAGSGTFNPNSFSSIFSRDHEEISGIQRVFKKSISLMVIDLILFGFVVLGGVNLFGVSPLFTIISSILFIVCTNVFYIVVADRSYVWLSLVGQLILLLLVHSFLGQGFDPITITGAALITLFSFMAYTELEKVQLGSRLFSVSHVTGETTRIMSTVVVLVLCLGVFNGIIFRGIDDFTSKVFLNNQTILDNYIIGKNPDMSLNRVTMKGYQLYGATNTTNTFRSFLTNNYHSGKPVISEAEESDIIVECENRLGVGKCGDEIALERDKRLEVWRQEAYPKITYGLDEVLDKTKFEEVTKQHYLYLVRSFNSGNGSNVLIIIPRNYIIPAGFAVILYILLIIIKPIFSWLVYLSTWLIWSILKATGFVKIEVEAVEAEVVSI